MRISDWSSDVCSSDLLRRGVSLLWLSVRAQWQPFLVSVTGAALYAVLVVGATIVLGRVTDDLIVPAFDGGEVSHGAVVGGVLALLLVALLKVLGVVLRRYFGQMAQRRMQVHWFRIDPARSLDLTLRCFDTPPAVSPPA